MSETKFANNDINKISEWTKRIESELLALKMEKKTQSSMSLQVIGNGINKDGDILKADSLVVPTGKEVTFLISFYSIYQDFAGNIYSPAGYNASLLTAESDYLVWNVLGINAGTWYTAQLNWTAGTKRIYTMQWILGAGTYSNLKLYARIEEQNSTPEYRNALFYAFWIAMMSIKRTESWVI